MHERNAHNFPLDLAMASTSYTYHTHRRLMTEPHPLTRRQKLLAARSVQLGNIAEALVDRFDFNQQVFDLDGDVAMAEAKVSVFDKRIEALRERIKDFRRQAR